MKKILIAGITVVLLMATAYVLLNGMRVTDKHASLLAVSTPDLTTRWPEPLTPISGPPSIAGMEFDENGVMITQYGSSIGTQRNPLFISNLVRSMDGFFNDPTFGKIAAQQLSHLIDTADKTALGNKVFPYHFDFAIHQQTAPWYSAMAQANIGSAFIKAGLATGNTQWLLAGKQSFYALDEPAYAFTKSLENGIWLKEYPGWPYHVLDGFLYSLAVMAELLPLLPPEDDFHSWLETKLAHGIQGFLSVADCFISPVIGHYYDDAYNVPTAGYYQGNLALLAYLSGYEPQLETWVTQYQTHAIQGLTGYWRAGMWRIERKQQNRMARSGELKACVR